MATKKEINELTFKIIGAALEVHKALGPGLLESVYHKRLKRELAAVEVMAPVFEAQILTYMKLLEKPKGILINFNCSNLFKEGQKTFVNEYFRNLLELYYVPMC